MYPLTIVPLTAAGTDGPCDFLEYGSVTLKTETAAPARGDR